MYSVQISEELGERLAALAEKTHRPESFYAEKAFRQLLEDEEDYLLGLSRRGEEGTSISLEELVKELKLDDETPVNH